MLIGVFPNPKYKNQFKLINISGIFARIKHHRNFSELGYCAQPKVKVWLIELCLVKLTRVD